MGAKQPQWRPPSSQPRPEPPPPPPPPCFGKVVLDVAISRPNVMRLLRDEREACARIADTCTGFTYAGPAAIAIAATIRGRGDK